MANPYSPPKFTNPITEAEMYADPAIVAYYKSLGIPVPGAGSGYQPSTGTGMGAPTAGSAWGQQPQEWYPQQAQGTNPTTANPYAPLAQQAQQAQQQWNGTNPYAPQGWAQWQAPTDEVSKAYYSKNPQGAMGLFSRAAGGSPGGNLEAFMKQLAQQQYENYISQNLKPGGENLHYTDMLTPQLKQQGWQQWQAQTPYQRGENASLFMGAGRRT